MPDFVNITFNQDSDERFTNQETTPSVTVNGDVTIERVEVFSGTGSGNFNGTNSDYLSIANDSAFDFGDSSGEEPLYIKFAFFVFNNTEYGLIGRRANENDRWHVKLDITDPDTPRIKFFANIDGTQEHSVNTDFSASLAQVELGKWHVFEMLAFLDTGGDGVVRFWIDGTHIADSSKSSPGLVDCNGNATTTIGLVNDSATSTSNFVTFSGYIDSVLATDVIPTGYDTDTAADHYVDKWTGDVTRLFEFDPTITPQPSLYGDDFPNNIPDFARANNQLYIAGIKPMKKVDNTTVKSVGLTKPTLDGTPVTESGGGTDDEVEYVITVVDERGVESPSSDSAGPYDKDDTLTVKRPATFPDDAVTWRVYRRQITNQARYFLVKDELSLDTDATWVDNVALNSESISRIAPLFTEVTPYPSNYIEEHNFRLYFADVEVAGDRFATRVYFSKINNYDLTTENSWFYVGQDDGEVITGMISFRGGLLIFKETSMYFMIGDPEATDFNLIKIVGGVGCVAHQTIQLVQSRVVWLADEGVYMYDGGDQAVLITDMIEPLFERIPPGRKQYASAAIDLERGLYLLSLSIDRDDINDAVLCYHFRDSFIDNIHRWTRWNIETAGLAQGYIGTGRRPQAFFGDYDGRIGTFEDGLDFEGGITFNWQTGFFNPFDEGKPMHLRYLTFGVNRNSNTNVRIQVGYQMDNNPEDITNFDNPQSNLLKVAVRERGEYISMIYRGFDVRESPRLYNFVLSGNEIGQR